MDSANFQKSTIFNYDSGIFSEAQTASPKRWRYTIPKNSAPLTMQNLSWARCVKYRTISGENRCCTCRTNRRPGTAFAAPSAKKNHAAVSAVTMANAPQHVFDTCSFKNNARHAENSANIALNANYFFASYHFG